MEAIKKMPVALIAALLVQTVGGLVWALSEGKALDEAFRYAMAAGAAALLSPGTNLCDPADVERLHRDVVVTAA